MIAPAAMTDPLLDSIVKARGGTGAPTGADSADAARQNLQEHHQTRGSRSGPARTWHELPRHHRVSADWSGGRRMRGARTPARHQRSRTSGAHRRCGRLQLLLSGTRRRSTTTVPRSSSPTSGAAASAPKCRATDPRDWGADAIFTIENRKMVFQSYYKLPAPQTAQENCVAHNGSLIPIPGRDIMVQAWYQGGISVFDWTDPKHPTEIAFFDRGPVDCDPHGHGRQLVGVLVQRLRHQLRDLRVASTCSSSSPAPFSRRTRSTRPSASTSTSSTRRGSRRSCGRRRSYWLAPTWTSSSGRMA